MARRVRVALSGLGSVAQRGILPHLACADAQERIETVACCDVVPGRAEETARKFGWREAYQDFAELLRKADVEAVLLATPIPAHFPQTMAALAAGKDVYVQKAMTTTLAEADAVVEAAGRFRRTLVASPGQMLRPTFQYLQRLLRANAIGKLYWAFSDTSGGGHEHERFRTGDDVLSNVNPTWYYRAGGGPMYDMAVYPLHAITGILGPVKRVTAMSGIGLPHRQWKDERITVEMDDNTVLLLDFGDNVYATVGGHNSVSPPGMGFGRLWFSGSEGGIDSNGGTLDISCRSPLPAELLAGLEVIDDAPAGRPHRSGSIRGSVPGDMPHVSGEHLDIPERHVYADIMHLVDCIVEEREPIASGAHARHVVELIEKGYAAGKTGQAQELRTTF
ncbi:MAG: Gfo/Idh/MocA family protein [Solirubrobacteraceae bacterium]